MKQQDRIQRVSLLAAALLTLLTLPAAAAEPPAQSPDTSKPVKVFIMMGQSNMVGMGDISGGGSRWGKQFLDPVVSVYPGTYSPNADYDNLTPIATMKLAAFGGVNPTLLVGDALGRGMVELLTNKD